MGVLQKPAKLFAGECLRLFAAQTVALQTIDSINQECCELSLQIGTQIFEGALGFWVRGYLAPVFCDTFPEMSSRDLEVGSARSGNAYTSN
jgi:hypothetical protein